MISSEINETIVWSDKPSKWDYYAFFIIGIILAASGVYLYWQEGNLFILLCALGSMGVHFFMGPYTETHITEVGIYEGNPTKGYKVFRFSDLTYAYFEQPDNVYMYFGIDDLEVYSIYKHANHYSEIRSFFERISADVLPHHRYGFVDKKGLSREDKLGCVECKSKFGFSAITKWADEKSRTLFRKKKSNIAVCPSCQAEGTIVVSRTGKITNAGLESLAALRTGHQESPG